ncbi:hypothetical protein ACTHPF_20440 [Paenibacillus sp. SAF-054]|uniref:hypothetical protein n=1 Tax=unclassified Paenibacillus TaxID=185978 RepID=UPI003F7F5662
MGNRWTVFEFLKSRTLETGHIPTRQELDSEFADMDQEEVEGGIQEFGSRIGKWCRQESAALQS